jgi:hypothetical protein
MVFQGKEIHPVIDLENKIVVRAMENGFTPQPGI